MKSTFKYIQQNISARFTILLFLLFSAAMAFAQEPTDYVNDQKIYKVVTYDGRVFIGKIISQDAREVLIETKNVGQIAIPKVNVTNIQELKSGELNSSGEYVSEETFATRYFLTTNGLPVKKGESYYMIHLYGPEFHFGVAENLGIGVMTTWFASPMVVSVKHSFELNKSTHLGLGALLGTLSWAKPDFGVAVPFAALTYGDRRNNLSFSAGYGALFDEGTTEGRVLLSVAGMAKISNKASLVFDSFIAPSSGSARREGAALIIPGLRFQTSEGKAFQIGFAGLYVDGETVPAPFPLLSWFRKL